MTQALPTPLIDRCTAVELLRVGVADWEEVLVHLEDAKGRLRFRAGLTRAIKNLRIESYPLLYEKEHAMGVALAKAFLSDSDLLEAEAEFRSATPEERGVNVREFGELACSAIDALELPDEPTPQEEEAARAVLDSLPADELASSIRMYQLLLAGGLAALYDQLSLMVHGERITSLVAQAKAGNDQAFVKAVQIDGRVLTEIPYFRERYARARMEDEAAFLASVWRRQVAPPYRGRIEHKSLYLMFAFLDLIGLLRSFSHRELLDLYDELGMGRKGRRIEDEKNMGKRLAEFRRFQNRRHVSTP